MKIHHCEHLGDEPLDTACLGHQPPQVLAPNVKLAISFHDLPVLATLSGAIAAAHVGTTPAGMPMVGVAQSGQEAYQTHVASGVGTSQEGEAMILLSYIQRLAQQLGVYWLVRDCKAAVRALGTYHEVGHCGYGIHRLCDMVLGGHYLFPASAINAVTTPSHGINGLNVRLDAAAQEPPEVDLTWLLRRPFSLLPVVTCRDQCQLSPTALSDWLQDEAPIPPRVGYEARWGVHYTSSSLTTTISATLWRTAWKTSLR